MDVRQVGPSGRSYTDGLLAGQRWVGLDLTYSFPTTTAQFTGYPIAHPFIGFEAFNTAQQAAVRSLLASISTFTRLTFSESGASDASGAVLRFGMTDDIDDGVAAFAYLPSSSPTGGDSWYRNEGGYYDAPLPGNGAWRVIAHEIGHALGLAHPHSDDGGKPLMPDDRNAVAWTVMSYGGYPTEPWWWPQSYMAEDIAALQYLYGANFAYNNSNTVYRWSPATGELFINGVGQGAPGANTVFETIWDGGGQDTYDFSNHIPMPDESLGNGAVRGVTIDLRPGGWTVLLPGQAPPSGGAAHGNIANALQVGSDARSLIENAVGTLGDDSIDGNEAGNRLEGGAGNDVLMGHGGRDIMLGGTGNDVLWGGDGDDHLIGGWGDNQLFGEDGNDLLEGGSSNDRIVAGGGDDVIRAGDGDDDLNGGTGHNQLFGGAGQDSASFSFDFVEAGFETDAGGNVTVLGPGGSRDELFDIELLIFPLRGLAIHEVIDTPLPDFILVGRDGWQGSIGGSGTIFGTAGVQDITLLDDAGILYFDASFNAGGDRLTLAGAAAGFTATLGGSRVILKDNTGDTVISIPVGAGKTALQFADGVRNLFYDLSDGTVKIGSQTVAGPTIEAPAEPAGTYLVDSTASARLILLADVQVTVAGRYEIVGSVMPDQVSIAGAGRYVFDGSFNRGLDRIELDHDRSSYSVQLQGSRVTLAGAGQELSLPVGGAPTMIDFNGDERALYYETTTGTVWLGPDRIDATSSAQAVSDLTVLP